MQEDIDLSSSRRKLDREIASKLSTVDGDMVTLSKWQQSLIGMLLIYIAGGIWFAAEMHTELTAIIDRQRHMEDRFHELMAAMQSRTDDRFRRRDFIEWQNEFMPWLAEQLSRIPPEQKSDGKARN